VADQRDPRDLYDLHDQHDLTSSTGTADSGPVLLHVFTGFIDAGQAGALARDHLLSTLDHRPVATFDVDQLLDYRSRRPPMIFVEDHWESYEDPHLVLHEMTDAAGARFLLLEGSEPDILWERFVAAVRRLVDQLGVRLTIGMHGIPMGVPHTRPTSVTAHATRTELVQGRDAWVGTVQVPGAMTNLLEYRLGLQGHDAMGFAVHVPHYLARAEYPQAARVLVDHLAVATGLYLPTASLTSAAERAEREIAEQVEGSEEVAQVVAALERQYDTVISEGDERSSPMGGELPTADELGAEVERFLAGRDDADEDRDPDRRDDPGSEPPR
jgi:predicted ATP-grasp superfamily ATP-dependent carboligase